MSVIRIEPDEVEKRGIEFTRMHGEVEGLVNQASGTMSNLQTQFLGARAKMIFDQWEEMLPRLSNAIRTLDDAGRRLLKDAAADFRRVDMQ